MHFLKEAEALQAVLEESGVELKVLPICAPISTEYIFQLRSFTSLT
jgi:hypothetical protein